jgi:DNA-binding transcriptional LysR family regulator
MHYGVSVEFIVFMLKIIIANLLAMELTQLRSFYAIAQEGSVTRAARRLGLTQPALSLQIKALETEWGVALFARQRRQMQLTQAGELLYRHVQTVLATLEEAKAEVAARQHLLRGHLAIATSDTNCAYILPAVLRQCRAHYPQIRIDIRSQGAGEPVSPPGALPWEHLPPILGHGLPARRCADAGGHESG